MNLSTLADEPEPTRGSRFGNWAATVLALLVVYTIGAGPLLAIGCWLRDATGWDGFWFVFYLYLPLLYLVGDIDIFEAYLMWWMKLFGTMPPG